MMLRMAVIVFKMIFYEIKINTLCTTHNLRLTHREKRIQIWGAYKSWSNLDSILNI